MQRAEAKRLHTSRLCSALLTVWYEMVPKLRTGPGIPVSNAAFLRSRWFCNEHANHVDFTDVNMGVESLIFQHFCLPLSNKAVLGPQVLKAIKLSKVCVVDKKQEMSLNLFSASFIPAFLICMFLPMGKTGRSFHSELNDGIIRHEFKKNSPEAPSRIKRLYLLGGFRYRNRHQQQHVGCSRVSFLTD